MASKTVFLFGYLGALVMWIDVAAVPAVFIFRSENRTLLFQLVLAIPSFALGAYAMCRWPISSPPMLAPCISRRRDPRTCYHSCRTVCFVLAAVFCIVQAYISDQANPGGWLAVSPCTSSSCSQSLDTSAVVYNANGIFGSPLAGTQVYADFIPTVCTFQSCAWADGNGRNISAFEPQVNNTGCADFARPCTDPSCLAGNRTQDFPNLAIGIAGGMRSCLGVSTLSKTTTCPGTLVQVVGTTTVLKGRAPCSYCLPYNRKRGYVDPATAYCPSTVPNQPGAEDADFWCGVVCPGMDEVRTPAAMARQSIYAQIVAVLYVLSWVFDEAMRYIRDMCAALKKEEFDKSGGEKKKEAAAAKVMLGP